MSILTIRLFGEFRASDHRGNPLAIGSRKSQALLIWLALHRNTPVPLYDFGALFGVDDVAGLARDLRFALRMLPADLLAGDGDAIRFRPASVEVDVARFQMLLFTLVTAAFVLMNVVTTYVIPEISPGFQTLMGISNGVYLGSKIAQG